MAIKYSSLADPLIAYIESDRQRRDPRATSLLTPINYNADLFAADTRILTGFFGFEGYVGVPGIEESDGKQAAADNNVAWESVDPSLNPALRALTSASPVDGSRLLYGAELMLQDTLPVVFSYPVLPTTLDPDGSDFEVALNDGSVVRPIVAGLLPNLEYNERQTVVLMGEFGNRLQPGTSAALYPVSVGVVNDNTPLQMLSASGPVDAVGLSIASQNPYVKGSGPKLVAAKLNYFSALGEGGPIGVGSITELNDGAALYGDQEAQYRLRLYTNLGFSPDGIASLLPNDFRNYFILEAQSSDGEIVEITEDNQAYSIGADGSLTVIGLADLAPQDSTENAAYVEDHDNYYDIILKGDLAAVRALRSVRMPSGDGYLAVYDPGGPGNDPDAVGAATGPFTVPSEDHSIPITMDLDGKNVVSFVEVDGTVLRNPFNLLPVGNLLGVAVEDTISGQVINAFKDPYGLRFYTSFDPSTDQATSLPANLKELNPIDLIDTKSFAFGSRLTVRGSFSRSAADNSTLQFYAVTGADGGVVEPLTGEILLPGDVGYDAAARSSANLLISNNSTMGCPDSAIESFAFSVQAGKIYAPLLSNLSTGEQYFAFGSANRDGMQHYNGIGANGWGVEDLYEGGDRDFDDTIVRFSVVSV